MIGLQGTGPRSRDGWIPWAFVAFLAFVLAANEIMIGLAFVTWPGLETTDAYRKGIDYNNAIEAAREQAALGWRAELAFVPAGDGRRGRLELRLWDMLGQPIEHATVQAALSRPTQAGQDFAAPISAIGGGVFAADLAFPLAGIWDVRAQAQHRGRTYLATRRVVVPE